MGAELCWTFGWNNPQGNSPDCRHEERPLTGICSGGGILSVAWSELLPLWILNSPRCTLAWLLSWWYRLRPHRAPGFWPFGDKVPKSKKLCWLPLPEASEWHTRAKTTACLLLASARSDDDLVIGLVWFCCVRTGWHVDPAHDDMKTLFLFLPAKILKNV